MIHHRVQSAGSARLFLTVIGLALLGIACQNPLQSPPTFQDKFNQIRLTSNETRTLGMTLTEVREVIGGQGTELPYSVAEKAALLSINPRIRVDRLSRYEWIESPDTITVVFYFGAASIKSFTTS